MASRAGGGEPAEESACGSEPAERHGPILVVRRMLSCARSNREGNATMKISARNQLKGTVVEVRKGQTTAHIRIDLGNGAIVTSSITNEAVDELRLAAGDSVTAIIKASDVMVGK
jgi:molybdopterin-binding protein